MCSVILALLSCAAFLLVTPAPGAAEKSIFLEGLPPQKWQLVDSGVAVGKKMLAVGWQWGGSGVAVGWQ